MNREIKFRAYDNKEKKWLLGYELPNLGGFSMFGETMLCGEWNGVINRFILQQRDRTPGDLILMQYTGLKDKNGKDIYEGDIVRLDEVECPITWEDGGFQMITDKQQGRSAAMQDRLKRFEVIGNIYENNI